jgi:two-component system, NtrC family, nitrogen regulation sensor histidine kinase NtrY
MRKRRTKKTPTFLTEQDRKRQKREGILIIGLIGIVALMTFAGSRWIHFGSAIPISDTILMFILTNINMLLVILLIFLVVRNLVKLLYDRKRKVMGAKLRTRLVVAFIALTLLPASVLFIFSINFITKSVDSWFNVPVEQALDNSLRVGRRIYTDAEENHRFFLEKISYDLIAETLLDSKTEKALFNYTQITRGAYNLDAMEIYSAKAQRLTLSISPKIIHVPLPAVSANDLQKDIHPKGVRSISAINESGELFRTIGTVPFGIKPTEADAYVVLTNVIPMELSESMASISRGFEEYQQIELLKRPIQITYYITLTIVALLVAFCAIWFGFYLAKSITIPIMELAEGTRRVAEGDLKFSIAPVADDEIGTLVDSFNKMTRDLRIGREQLELSAQKLKDQNVEIEARRNYMEIVLKSVSAGVITMDGGGIVTTINISAEKMLKIDSVNVLNKSYKYLLKGQRLDLANEIIETVTGSKGGTVEMPLRLTIDGRPKSFMVHVNALKDDSGRHLGIVMVFDDLTDLEKAQRMAAWREVARRIAHEVKNPLTPISLSAQRLKRKYSGRLNEPVFDECTQMIIDHVDLIRNLVNEFSSFARFPAANPKPMTLPPIIEETVALYRQGHYRIEFRLEISDTIPILNLDRQQIRQAIINLLDNAIGAVKENGAITIKLAHDPILNRVRIEVADNGSGISDEDKTRLFEPYFSTKRAGMGLGLTIVSTIIADHHGMISVQDNNPQGAKFVIELPV